MVTSKTRKPGRPAAVRKRTDAVRVLDDEVTSLRRELNETLQQQAATAEVLKAISRSAFNLQDVLETLLSTAASLCSADNAYIYLLQGTSYRLAACSGFSHEYEKFLKQRAIVPGRDTLVARTALERRFVHIPDVLSDVEYKYVEAQRRGGFRTVLGIPMLRDGKAMGVLSLSRSTVNPFNERQIRLVETFADQAVIAIENARLFNETKEALARQTATSDILRVISQSPTEVQPVFDAIVLTAVRLLGCDMSFVMFCDRTAFWVAAAARPEGLFDELTLIRVPIDPSANFPSRAIVEKKVLHLPDWSLIDLPEHERNIHETVGINSALYLPLLREGECIGLLTVGGNQADMFGESEIALAESFRDQAMIAIENTRLFNVTQDALERQTATADILRVISESPTDVQPVFQAIAEHARLLCKAQVGATTRLEGDMVHLAGVRSMSVDAEDAMRSAFPMALESASPNIRRAIIEQAPVQIPDVHLDSDYAHIVDGTQRMGFRSIMSVPLMHDGRSIGTIGVAREEPGLFPDAAVQLLQTFANQAVIAIENVRLFNETREALERQTATAEILKVIASSPSDVQPVFEAIVESAKRLLGGFSAAVFRFIDGIAYLQAITPTNPAADEILKNSFPRPVADFQSFAMVQDGRIVQTSDTEALSNDIRDIARARGFRSMLIVPLMSGGTPIGMISVTRVQTGTFPAHHEQLLQTFADQAVIAIENTRLFNEVRRRTEDLSEALQQQTATADVLKVISRSAFDLQPVLDALLASACRLCEADFGTIRYQDGSEYRLAATLGCKPEWIQQFSRYSARPDRSSVFGRTIVEGHIVHIPDVLADPDFKRPEAQKLMGFRAALGVPLVREGQTFGVINLFRVAVGSFSAKQIELVQTFADQAVIAIQNVRLFDEVQARTEDLRESLQQQTATADVLKVISRSAFDLQTVLDTLTESAARLSNADMAAIARKDDRGFYHATNYNFPVDWVRVADTHRLQPGRGSVIGRALLASKAVQIPDVLADPEYAYPDMQKAAGFRTLLGVPLMRSKEPVGVLFLGRKSVTPFSDKQIELVSTFADQAVIAIENVRLFDEVQAKTRDLSEALTYQTGSANILKVIASSPTDVEPVLRSIVESACELCEANDALVLLKDGDDLRFRAHYGPIEINVEKWPISRGWTAGRAFVDGEPVLLNDTLSEEGKEFPDSRALSEYTGSGVRTVLSVPLLSESERIGAITLRRTEVRPFNDKQINLLQTFANQAVIAIGNVRLFDEVQAKTRDLSEALTYQTGSGNILRVIASSPTEVGPVLEAIVESACQLCDAYDAVLRLKSGNHLCFSAHHGPITTFLDNWPISRNWTAGRAVIDRKPVQITDLLSSEGNDFPEAQVLARRQGHRTILSVPLLREGESIGAITLRRNEVHPFSDKQINLLQTFADQAVIAIGNVRLFEEVQARTRELSKSLDELRTAQDRLIQTEKLASLGQLTAGIAHEIKNPLNFVNNFAALSSELIDELSEVLKPTWLDDKTREEVDELTQMLKANLEKVEQHGKRADSIVRNMLLHSREGSGERRSADINAIVEESLNLAYHGARAERPGFNITLQRDLDPNAGTADVYPQEITRVFLNLISNGFYAAGKRREAAGEDFEPTLIATTKALGDEVEVRIRDNGTGIPEEVRARIFNPFFTTKPVGEGTGLGLSMSHDIVVKQHGGRIEVQTEPGQFTEFVITLPRTLVLQTNSGGRE